jgi:hypothetical protein
LNILKSAFEKLSADNLNQIKASTELTAKSVNPGGSLFGIAAEMLTSLRAIERHLTKGKSKESSNSGGKLGSAILMTVIGGKALTAIGKGLGVIVDAVNQLTMQPKELKEKMEALTLGINSISSIGPSILKFAGFLLLATPMLIIGAIAAPLFGLSLFIITKTLEYTSRAFKGKEMQQAIDNINKMGKAILILGTALALSLPLYAIGIVALPLVAVTLLAIGGLFFLLDKLGIDKSMKDTGKALVFAAAGILALGISIALLALAMTGLNVLDSDPMKALGFIIAAIGGIGITFAIIGVVSSFIKKGAVAMLFASMALITIGFGVMLFAKAMPDDNPYEFMAQVGLFVVGLGAAMALAGVGAGFIIPGAAAMAIAGLALIAIAKGASSMGALFKGGGMDALLDDSGQVTESILGFGGGRKMSNMEFFMLSIARSFTLFPNQILSMYASAPALIMSGLALSSIAKGISKFQNMDIDYKTLPGNITTLVTVVANAFGDIGSRFPGGSKFLFGSQSPVADGIDAVAGMGSALGGIAEGVQNMADLKFPIYGTGKDATKIIGYRQLNSEVFNKVGINTGLIVNALASTFGEIGAKYPGGRSFLFGSQSPVADGIDAVSGMGNAISGIAEGVQSMASLKFPIYGTGKNATKIIGYHELKEDHFTKVSDNVGLIVTALSGTFAQIGASPNAKTGFWGGASDIQKGIELVTGMSQPLNAIANITKTFAELKVDTGSVATKIKSMIRSLSSLFSEDQQTVDPAQITNIGLLGDNLKKIARSADGFEKFKKSYGQFVDHHIRFKDSVNGFDKENLKLTSDMFTGLASLSKSDNAISQMGDQMADAIQKLAEMIEAAKSSITGGSTAMTNSTEALGTKIDGMSNTQTGTQQAVQDLSILVEAIRSLEDRFDQPIPVKVNGNTGLFR